MTRVLQPIQASAPGTFLGRSSTASPSKQQRTGSLAGKGNRSMELPEDALESKRAKLDPGQARPQAGTSAAVYDGGSRAAGATGNGPGAAAPTDFQNFAAQIRQRRGESSVDLAPACQDAGKAAKPSTFSNEAAQRQAFHAILKSLGDGRTLSRGPSAGMEGSLPVTGSVPNTAQSEAAVQHMPYDWALKRSARFTSSLPLTVCERALRMEPNKVAQAQAAFMANGSSGVLCNSGPSSRSINADSRLQAALLSWRFPEHSWDSGTVQALLAAPAPAAPAGATSALPVVGAVAAAAVPSGPGAVLAQRQLAWRNALRSAYVQLRCGRCPAFYLTSQASRPVSILFCGGGVRGAPQQEPHAVLSQSTNVMRSRLTNAGVPFQLPLAPVTKDERAVQQAVRLKHVNPEAADLDADPADDAALLLGGLGAAGSGGAGSRYTSVRDHSPESVLLVVGAQALHGLLDLLLNDVRFQDQQLLGISREAADLPALMAPVLFEGATLHRPAMRMRQAEGGSTAAAATGPPAAGRPPLPRQAASLRVNGALDDGENTNTGTAGGSGGSTGGAGGCVEITGTLPPWVVHRTWHVLQDCQRDNLQVQLETEPSCLSLNVSIAAAQQAQDPCEGEPAVSRDMAMGQWRGVMAATGSETQALCGGDDVMHRRVIKAAVCQADGRLLLKLS